MAMCRTRTVVALVSWLCLGADHALGQASPRPRILIDADANNELDDQHALAYVLLNGDDFDLVGITVNATRGGGDVRAHYEEARRVIALCGQDGRVPLKLGANGSFQQIRPRLAEPNYDGKLAVDFIIAQAHASPAGSPLVLLPIGKLTNVALALARDPSIAAKVRIVWLGSNYPEPGEYNQDNDPESLRFVLAQDVPFEMVTVRYGKPSGTDAIRVTPDEVKAKFAGRGPKIGAPVTGRHGNAFQTFGDYAVNLFQHIELNGTPPSRALYDLAAAAIVKNPGWATSRVHPAPALAGKTWKEQPNNPRTITIWEHFDRDAIVGDLQETLAKPVPAKP